MAKSSTKRKGVTKRKGNVKRTKPRKVDVAEPLDPMDIDWDLEEWFEEQVEYKDVLDRITKGKGIDYHALSYSALRRGVSRSKLAQAVREMAVDPLVKGPRGGRRETCYFCRKPFPSHGRNTDIEHVECVTKVFLSTDVLTLDTAAERSYNPEGMVVVTCRGCHKIKTAEERKARAWWRKKTKYLVVRERWGKEILILEIKDLKTFNKDKYILVEGFITRQCAEEFLKEKFNL